ncbi:PA2169 family four-helix-bundle protein [Pseudomonas sp. SH1-B]
MDKTIARLNHLLVASHDATLIYRHLASNAASADQQRLFSTREQECVALMSCLQNQVVAYGGMPSQQPSVSGVLRRSWFGLKTALAADSARVRMRAALATEKTIRHGFEQLLGEQLSAEFRQQLQEHNSLSVEFERQFRARL